MTRDEFTDSVTKIVTYLGAKKPEDSAVKAWLAKVERIPTNALPYIVERITDECDRMPANIPKLFRALYAEWQGNFGNELGYGNLWFRGAQQMEIKSGMSAEGIYKFYGTSPNTTILKLLRIAIQTDAKDIFELEFKDVAVNKTE